MRTQPIQTWAVVCLTVLTGVATFSASADQATTAVVLEKSHGGIVTSLDPLERKLSVKAFWRDKKFNLGENCTFLFPDQRAGTINDLKPGQKVTVRHQNADGVLVAHRVEQQPMRVEGTVKAIDDRTRTLAVRLRGGNRTIVIADDCKVLLRDGKVGTLADVEPGHHVAVLYEVPSGTYTAREIAQTSATFSGSLSAIDTQDRTIKATHLLGTREFHLANGCVIMSEGKPNGKLSDLKLGDKLTLSYDEINGVNVVNRIAREETPAQTLTAESSR